MPARYTTVKFEADGVTSTTTSYALDWEDVRRERDTALMFTDKYTYADRWSTLTAEQQTELTTFRSVLRDIPQTFANAEDVIFPVKPSWLNEVLPESLFTGE